MQRKMRFYFFFVKTVFSEMICFSQNYLNFKDKRQCEDKKLCFYNK